MNISEITPGTQIKDTRFDKVYIVTSVTEKRVNLDLPGSYSKSSTGRSSSKFYEGHKLFLSQVADGTYLIIK